MLESVKIKLKYICNFSPLFKNIDFDNRKIYCKYFFFLLLFLEYYFYKNLYLFICYHFKKFKNCRSYLRAPNRYKTAQVKFKLIRYEFYIILKLNFFFLNIYCFINFFNLFNFFNSSYIHIYNKKFFFYSFVKLL